MCQSLPNILVLYHDNIYTDLCLAFGDFESDNASWDLFLGGFDDTNGILSSIFVDCGSRLEHISNDAKLDRH